MAEISSACITIEKNFSCISSYLYDLSTKVNDLANQFNELSYNMRRINCSSEIDYNFSDYFNNLMYYINKFETQITDLEREVKK